MNRRRKRFDAGYWATMALFFLVYFGTARLGLAVDTVSGFASLVWSPTGIALATLFILGYRFWPSVALGTFLVNVSLGAPFLAACGMALGNSLEALMGAFLLRRAGFRADFSRVRDVLALVFWAAFLSTWVSATLGVGSLLAAGVLPPGLFFPTWRAWWAGDMLGDLVVAPFIFLLVSWSPARGRVRIRRMSEAFLLAALVGSVNHYVFCRAEVTPASYVVFLPLIWAALRFGPPGAILTIFATSLIAVWGTAHGQGPFSRVVLAESLLFLEGFMGVVSVTTLLLASAVGERVKSERKARESEGALRRARDHLERIVLERTQELREINQALSTEVAERRRADEELRRAYAQLKKTHEELKAARWQLTQAEKMETVGRLAAGVAHEVKNPLSIILMGVHYLSKYRSSWDATTAEVMQDMTEAIHRADGVVKELMDFSAYRELSIQEESLNDVMERTLRMVRHALGAGHIRISKELQPDIPPLRLDRNKIEQVFVNLFMNAIDAMPGGGQLAVRTRVEGDRAVAEVEDTGAGIPPDNMNKVFDPFFTTKPQGKGTGLGLAVTRQILELHGGEIALHNRPEGGVRAVVRLKLQAYT